MAKHGHTDFPKVFCRRILNVIYPEHRTETVIQQCKTLKKEKIGTASVSEEFGLHLSEGAICSTSKPFCSNECLTSPRLGI